MNFNNSRLDDHRTCSPTTTRPTPRPSPPPTTSRCCAASASTAIRQQIAVTQVNREIAEEALRATIAAPSPTSATPTGTWSTPAPPSTSRSDRSSWPRSWSRTTRPGSRSARWRRSTSSRPRPKPPPGARPWPRSKPRWPRRSWSLKRLHRHRHQRPAVDARSCAPSTCPQLDAPPIDIEGAVRRALDRRTDLATARKNLDSNDVTLRYWRNESLPGARPAGQLRRPGHRRHAVHPRGHRHRQPGHRHHSRRLHRCAVAARRARLPDLERRAHRQLSDRRQRPPTPSTRAPGSCATSRATRLRALELQVATEVTNAALQVQSQPAPRRRRPRRARAGRAAARGRAEQVRGRPVDQLLRRPGAARPGRRRERRAARAHRPAEVAGHLRARPGSAGQRHRRRRAADGGPERRHHRHRRQLADGVSAPGGGADGSGRRTVYAELSVRYGVGVMVIAGAALLAGACSRGASEGAAAAQTRAGPAAAARRRPGGGQRRPGRRRLRRRRRSGRRWRSRSASRRPATSRPS